MGTGSRRRDREPMDQRLFNVRGLGAVAAGLLVMVAGCTSATSAGVFDDPPPTSPVADAEVGSTSTAVTIVPLPSIARVPASDISTDGVLAAAVIIVSDGDLETAIAEGLITEAEAEAALHALETGTLDSFVEP